MATTKHIATADGQTFTRNSKSRVYTHCVVAKPSIDCALERAQSKAARDLHRSNYRWYQKAITSEGRLFEQYKYVSDEQYAEQCEYDLARAVEALAGAQSEDEYISRKVGEELAGIAAQDAKGFYDTWAECGWCGRFDLAQKLAATKRNHGYYGDVVILEAVQL